jgi:hypothetical protein
VTAVAAFLARQDLGVVALLDSDDAGKKARDDLERIAEDDLRGSRIAVLELARAAGLDVPDATIEDLLDSPLYLDAVRDACEREEVELAARCTAGQDAAAERPAGGNLASRLARAFERENRKFPKGRVAAAPESRLAAMTSVADLPPELLVRARRLVQALRDAADRVRSTATTPVLHDTPENGA